MSMYEYMGNVNDEQIYERKISKYKVNEVWEDNDEEGRVEVNQQVIFLLLSSISESNYEYYVSIYHWNVANHPSTGMCFLISWCLFLYRGWIQTSPAAPFRGLAQLIPQLRMSIVTTFIFHNRSFNTLCRIKTYLELTLTGLLPILKAIH